MLSMSSGVRAWRRRISDIWRRWRTTWVHGKTHGRRLYSRGSPKRQKRMLLFLQSATRRVTSCRTKSKKSIRPCTYSTLDSHVDYCFCCCCCKMKPPSLSPFRSEFKPDPAICLLRRATNKSAARPESLIQLVLFRCKS